MRMYSHIVLGGTFDHFHGGHKKLISMALSLSSKVTIGLTVDAFIQTKAFSYALEPYQTRHHSLQQFLHACGRFEDVSIVPIDSVYGTTLEDESLEAIVVTEATKKGAEQVNSEREKKGWKPFPIHMCPYIFDAKGDVLSSTHIRAGKVNRDGYCYSSLFEHDIYITSEQTALFHTPIGDISPSLPQHVPSNVPLVCVGDVVTRSMIDEQRQFTAAYIDGRSQRETYHFDISSPYMLEHSHVSNKPGSIQHLAAQQIQGLSTEQKNIIFVIDGEEDLLTAPLIALLPLESMVLYGQPHQGVVCVRVTEDKKEWLRGVLCV
ncbi:hypothetical protein C5B42_04635 [Candidatus Cerribacteria bacterium 'Amazon FNV 2010 28 9']|uniref:Cytidyltransferase-like domain-containing protein n=1 Tax=Candidatus Cerribacteria bacterium 'Amazon FNV 2010 28 9' TaxID=2081795 RepID=A0A317JPB0_9BACT|nr:MAG: hypothetical protein C5B42_04635 [Candidatus Cerribacteria bacterium 'Amazon FNV 2010 28 9']